MSNMKMNLNPQTLKGIVDNVSELGITTIIEGAAGIGKTEMLKKIVKAMKVPHWFTSSYVIAEGDTQPIISPNVQTGMTNTDLSSLMKGIISISEEMDKYTKEDKEQKYSKAIVFLDEANLLYPSDLKAILHWFNEGYIDIPAEVDTSFLDEKKIVNKKYDISNLVLISAWNDPEKGFMTANAVDPSMVSRLAIVHAEMDKENFKDYIIDSGFDSDVIAFISTNMEKIEGADADNEEGKVSPRMLEKLSDVMKNAKAPGGLFSEGKFDMLRFVVNSLFKSDSLTTIFMKSLENKDRIELDKLLNMSKKEIKEVVKKMPANEQIRLSSEFIFSPKNLVKEHDEQWAEFIRDMDSEAQLSYLTQVTRAGKMDNYQIKFPNVDLISAAETQSYEEFFKLFSHRSQTSNILKDR